MKTQPNLMRMFKIYKNHTRYMGKYTKGTKKKTKKSHGTSTTKTVKLKTKESAIHHLDRLFLLLKQPLISFIPNSLQNE